MYQFNSQPQPVREVILPQGMEIDVSEAWRKLISSQFGGSPGRGFGELIQNFLDSYPASTPWRDRRGTITTGEREITLVDFGEGMDRKRLQLLLTLGGTDKMNDVEKIGTFGVGFFSIFNPRLATEKVVVTTRCEGQVVQMEFLVREHGKRPEIAARILGEAVPFSTRIHITFGDPASSRRCLEYAQKCLQYYPCRMTINGTEHRSVWEIAESKGLNIFRANHCDGVIDTTVRGHYANVLCKYEHIMDLSIPGIVTGGHRMHRDLRDYRLKEMVCVDPEKTIINSNRLNVTISRDSFKMDAAYREMVDVLKQEMTRELLKMIRNATATTPALLANQYILADRLGKHLRSPDYRQPGNEAAKELYTTLLDTKCYAIDGRSGLFSLNELHLMKSDDLPLFFSAERKNINWLNGAFRHDFIVVPPPMCFKNGAPDFYDVIFAAIFQDCVNLDGVEKDGAKVRELVQRSIVPEELLEPDLKIAGERDLTPQEQELIAELGGLFGIAGVKKTICDELHADFQHVRVAFFELQDQGTIVASGLFDEDGNVLKEADYQHLELSFFEDDDQQVAGAQPDSTDRTVVLGLNRNSRLVRNMLAATSKDRSFFMLPVLANELALNQKWLMPYSATFDLVRENLAAQMRRSLLDCLVQGAEPA